MEEEKIIQVKNLTKDYGLKRGVFDISFDIKKGEVFGFVGTNGSGKTTIIRHLMGFLKAQKGSVQILGKDAWHCAPELKKYISYIPGEIAFPDLNSGVEFLQSQAELLNLKDMNFADNLIQKLQLDPTANLKRMSKGMKQKTAIVAALMSDKPILILDEPTTGLDPLMRETFLELIMEEKKKGKTILISSQMFDELEYCCDRVAFIFKGHIVDIADISTLQSSNIQTFKIEFTNAEDYKKFKRLSYEIIRDQKQYNQVTIRLDNSQTKKLFTSLSRYDVKFISEIKHNLEKHFKNILKENIEKGE